MPRDLGDVIHHFIPEARSPDAAAAADEAASEAEAPVAPRPGPRVIGLPMRGADIVRAAFAWNLGVELARAGARARIVAASDPATAAIWPPAGEGPLGSSLELVAPEGDAARAVCERAAARPAPLAARVRGARSGELL